MWLSGAIKKAILYYLILIFLINQNVLFVLKICYVFQGDDEYFIMYSKNETSFNFKTYFYYNISL